MTQPLSIAVLPFSDLSKNADNEYFCEGLAEDIINLLAKIQGLRLISRTTSFHFRDHQLRIPELGQQLGVRAIIEGSVKISDNKLKVNARLIDTEEDVTLWSKSWDRSFDDLFDIQNELSLIIAENLRENFWHFDIEPQLIKKSPASVEAYHYYLKGRYFYLKWNLEDIKNAIQLFEKAVNIDPTLAEAYVGLNYCYSMLAGMGLLPAEETCTKVEEYALKAIEANDQLAESHFAMGSTYFWKYWDLKKAFYHTDIALSLNPSYAEGHSILAFVYVLMGHETLAIKHLEDALRLDPFSPNIISMKGWIYYLLGKFDLSYAFSKEALDRNSDLLPSQVVLGFSMLHKGLYKEMINHFENIKSKAIDSSTIEGMLALAHLKLGDLEKFELHIEKLMQLLKGGEFERALGFLITIYGVKGDVEQAMFWMKKGLKIRLPLLLFVMKDPSIKPLEFDHEFIEIRNNFFINVPIDSDQKSKENTGYPKTWISETRKLLLEHFDQEQPYLNPGLNLRLLAEEMGLHPNQLSWLINNQFNKNFNEFVNEYRVNAFISRIQDPLQGHITFLGLAFDCGFNSKTVFNTCFKKVTGVTPRQYLNEKLQTI